MAITDKVIELSPVNKKKNIILYIIMGVLLATTVLFVVLFIIKPAATLGGISELEVTNNLYAADGKVVAVKGGTYTISATVKYTGELDTSLTWDYDSNYLERLTGSEVSENDIKTAVFNAASERVGEEDATLETKTYTEYFTFRPKSDLESGSMRTTITVKTNLKADTSENAPAKATVPVEIYIEDMGASALTFSTATANGRNPIGITEGSEANSYVLNVPYIANQTQPEYTVNLKQIPFTNSFGQEAVITNVNTSQPYTASVFYRTNSLFIETDDSGAVSVEEVGGYSPRIPESFYFRANEVGTSVITITYNKYNSSETKTAKLTVNVRSTSDLGVISDYYLMPDVVDSSASAAPSSRDAVKKLELYTGTGVVPYALQSHIAVNPWSRQNDWHKTFRVTSTDSGVVEVVTRASGEYALSPVAPGKATVRLVDLSPNAIGATLEIEVTVKYGVTNFGYSDSFTHTLGASSSDIVRAVKGSRDNELMLSYRLDVSDVKVEPDKMNASLKVSSVSSGITFGGYNKDTEEIVLTPTFASKPTGGTAIMHATLTYDVANNIGNDKVTITFTPIGAASASAGTLTVTFTPTVEATDIGFNVDGFDALKTQYREDNLIYDYASFEMGSNGKGKLTLNMSRDGTYCTPFTLADLLSFTDGTNDAYADGVTQTSMTSAPNGAFTLTRNDLMAKITPNRIAENDELSTKNGEITFKLGTKEVTLIIEVVDTPLSFRTANNPTEFYYGCPAEDTDNRNISESFRPGAIHRVYASGFERTNVDAYNFAIYVNTNSDENYLHAVYVPGLPYVYYCATQEIADELLAKTTSPEYTADWFRQEARRVAMIAVSSNFTAANLEVHYLQDFYRLEGAAWADPDWTKITSFGVLVCPYDESEGVANHKSQFASTAYVLTPIRRIDEIKITGGNTVSGSGGVYTDNVSSGSNYTLTIKALLKTSTAADSAHTSTYEVVHDNTDHNLESVRLASVTSMLGNQISDSNTFGFVMPVVDQNTPDRVTLTYAAGNRNVTSTLTVTVENKTLGIKSIKIYDADGVEIADGTYIPLVTDSTGAELSYSVEYFGISDAQGGPASDFIYYDSFEFFYDSTVACTSSDYAALKVVNANKAIPSVTSGGDIQREFTGSFTLCGTSPKLTTLFMRSGDSSVTSVVINLAVYTPAAGARMTDKQGNSFENSKEAGSNSVTLTLTNSTETVSKQWTLNRVTEVPLQNKEGGTSYTVRVETASAGDAGLIKNVNDPNADAVLEWSYNSGTRTLTISTLGKVTQPVSLKVVIDEYLAYEGGVLEGVGDGAPIRDFEIYFAAGVEANVFSTTLTLTDEGGTLTQPTGYQITTNGQDEEKSIELGVVLNGDNEDFAPISPEVRYVLMRGGKEVADNDTSSPLRIAQSSGKSYLVYNNNTLRLDAEYTLKAVADGVSSASVRITLVTTAEHITLNSVRYDGKAYTLTGGAVTVNDVSKALVFAASVYNNGTDNGVSSKTVSYSVVDMSGNAYASNPPATVNASGEVTFVSVSAQFKVRMSYAALEPVDVTVNVSNAVKAIRTNFDAGANDKTTDTLEHILGTEALDLSTLISLVGVGGRDAYTTDYTLGGVSNSAVINIEGTTLRFVGAGTATFTISAVKYSGATESVTKTVTVTVVKPKISAEFAQAGNSAGVNVSVNMMTLNADPQYTVSVSDTTGKNYTISGVALDGDALSGATPLFTYVGGVLTLNREAFDTIDLSAPKVYYFDVSAKANGYDVPDTVRLSVTVSATLENNTLTGENFSLYEGETKVGGELELGGSYKIRSLNPNVTLVFAVSNSDVAEKNTDDTLTLKTVGSFTVTATFVKYGKTFNAANSLTFVVKNAVGSVSGSLASDADGSAMESFAADYTIDSTKKHVFYIFDYSATGESFAASDFNINYGSGVLSLVGAPNVNNTTKKAVWEFVVEDAGSVTVWASAGKNDRYYAASPVSATFTMDVRPTSLEIDDLTLAPGDSDAFEAAVGYNDGTYTPINYTIAYTVMSGADFITLGGTGNAEYHAVLTESGGTARIRATLRVENGKYAGETLEAYFTVTVSGIKKSTVTQNKNEVILKVGEEVDLSTAEYLTVKQDEANTGETYVLTASDTSNTISLKNGTVATYTAVQEGSTDVTLKVTFSGGKYRPYDSDTFNVHVVVLPTAAADSASYGYSVGAGGSVPLSMKNVTVNGKPAEVYATYKIIEDNGVALVEGAQSTLGSISGGIFTAKALGGYVKVEATPWIASGAYTGTELEKVTFTVYVRSLALKGGTTLSVQSGSDIEGGLKPDMFELVGSPENGNATIASVTTNSALLTVRDNKYVSARAGANDYYFTGTTAPANKTEYITVTLTLDSMSYTNTFPIAITPIEVGVTESYRIDDGETQSALPSDTLELKEGDTLTVTLTLSGGLLNGLRVELDGTLSGTCETSRSGGTSVTMVFTAGKGASSGDLTLKLTLGGKDYTYKTLNVNVSALTAPEITAFSYAQTDGYVADGATPTVTENISGTYKYAIVYGGEYADVNESTGAITLKHGHKEDGTFVVEATLTVSGNGTLTTAKSQVTLKAAGDPAPAITKFEYKTNGEADYELSGFGTGVTPTFEIIAGGNYASLAEDGSGDLTGIKPQKTAVTVTVKLTVTVSVAGSAYNGETFTATAIHTIPAATAPAITKFEYKASGEADFELSSNFGSPTFEIISGSEYATLSGGNLTALKSQKTAVTVVVKLTVTVSGTNTAYDGETLTATATFTIPAADAPEEFVETKQNNRNYNFPADYTVTYYVIKGNVTVEAKEDNAFELTFTEKGEVKVLFVGVYNKDGSPYKGDTFTHELTVDVTEDRYVQDYDNDVKLEQSPDTAKINFVKTDEVNATITSVKVGGSEADYVTIDEEGKSASIDVFDPAFVALTANGNVTFTVTVTVTSEFYVYADNTFTYTVTLKGVSFNSETYKLTLPAFMIGKNRTLSVEALVSAPAAFEDGEPSDDEPTTPAVSVNVNTEGVVTLSFVNNTSEAVTVTGIKVTIALDGSDKLYEFTLNFAEGSEIVVAAPTPEPEPEPEPNPDNNTEE